MRLTVREATEEVFGVTAFSQYISDKQEAANSESDEFDDFEPTIRTDEKAKKLADTPLLTGDLEFDAIELAETADDLPLIAGGNS